MGSPREFTVAVSDEAIEDLYRRLSATRWPDAQTCDGWNQGVPLAYAQELADYWRRDYDWRRAEAALNARNQYLIDLEVNGSQHTVHYIHERSPHEGARPLILTHGWPGSVQEFLKVIDALVDPVAHGGRAEDAFHVVIPSMPGYGFSSKPRHTGTSVEHIADLWNELMAQLGYPHYFAQGGDWGSVVTCAIGLRHWPRCSGINLNMILAAPDPESLADPSPVEQAALAAAEYYNTSDSGYSKEQSTRPQTLAYALADSPTGQLAWIVEKFWSWSDCERDGSRHPEHAVSRDEMLDIVSLYWFSNSAGSSARLYWESFNTPNMDPMDVPMGGSLFPHDIFLASERWAKQRFRGLCYWNELLRGGHFAALEQPALFVDEMRACFARMTVGAAP